MTGQLAGRTAIVTGGARGIGLAYAIALAAAGARVAMLDLAPVANDMDVAGARYFHCDVADPVAIDRAVAAVADWAGTPDILVNNAAMFSTLDHTGFGEIPLETWDQVMAVNVRGPWLMARAVSGGMIAAGRGKIVNIASAVAFKGLAGMTHYVASKSALLGLTKNLALELGPSGINVNTLAPGLIRSDSIEGNQGFLGANAERVMASRSIKREGHPADLIGALLFLVGSDSDFVNGQTLVVDGGSVTL